jgi:8-oxo-dGTP diphosphatase
MKEAVCGIIFDEEKKTFLLIKRRDIPVWVLPGGGIEPPETPEQAVLRELEEETGCRVAIVRKIAEYLPVNRLTHLTHFFECAIVEGTPVPGTETKDVQFFTLDTLPLTFVPFYKDWITDAKHRSPLIRKPIQGVSYLIFFKFLFLHPILVARFLLSRAGFHWNS